MNTGRYGLRETQKCLFMNDFCHTKSDGERALSMALPRIYRLSN